MRPRQILLWLWIPVTGFLLSCGGDEGTGPGGGSPARVIKIQGDAETAEVGTAVPTDPTVEVRSASGEPLENRTVEFSVTSGDGSVAPASATTDSRGRASTTWTLGTSTSTPQSLEARSGSESVTFTADAVPGPPAGIRIAAGDDQVGEPGSPLSEPLVARVVDGFGNPVPDVTVTFEAQAGSVSPSRSTTDDRGRAGTTATLGPLDRFGDGVTVLPVSLDRARQTLPYEASLTSARSTSFSASADGAGSVPFAAHAPSGETATWSLASGSGPLPQGLSLSYTGLISGTPDAAGTGEFTVEAEESGGGTGSRTYELEVCDPPIRLSSGETFSIAPPAPGECGLFLPSGSDGDRYRVAVVWPSSVMSPDDPAVTLSVRGRGVASTTAGRPARAVRRTPPPLPLSAERVRRDLERMEATARLHRRLLEDGARLSARLGPAAVPPGPGAAVRAPEQTSPPRMRSFTTPVNSCSAADSLRARLVLESEELLFYQDSAQHASTEERVDSVLARQMADYYGSYGRQVIDDYFGGVSDIDGNGRVIVLITPAPLIDRGDALAFVLSRDFFSPDRCAGSNEAEITYFSADGINAMESGADPASFQALGALVHEVKHISSFHKRIQAEDLTSRPTWIEEGTADIAAELSSRIAWSETGGPAPGDEVTGSSFAGSGSMTATPENWGVFLRMARTVAAWASQPNSLTNNPVPGHSFRGSSWHFHRFLGDAYAGGVPSDSAFFRRQNAASAAPGVAFYRNEIGTSYPTLVEEHAVAAMVNGTSAGGSVERTFSGYAFPSAAELFCSPNPLGVYPWPVTTTGSRQRGSCDEGYAPDAEVQNPSASFATDTYEGPVGRGGMRIHDFVSDGTGQGAEINVDVASPAMDRARLIGVRLR